MLMLAGALLPVGCMTRRAGIPSPVPAAQTRALIAALLPPHIDDQAGWARDIQSSFAALGLSADRQNVCAVIAVTQQESGFQVDPAIASLGTIASREIDRRAENAGLPLLLLHAALALKSPDGRTFAARIRAARTERQLSDIYDDFIRQVPLGRRLFEDWNPVRTRGPMQVNVVFARRFNAVRPYPFPTEANLEGELFTRRGSLYFGIAHLLAYNAPYDGYIYRFADYNAGQYASRNAAFQSAVALASGRHLLTDGALLPGEQHTVGSTEAALQAIREQLRLSDADIHAALEEGDQERFGRTSLYQLVFRLAERRAGHPLPRARMPDIKLSGPKITHPLTTRWYAQRVNARFARCERKEL